MLSSDEWFGYSTDGAIINKLMGARIISQGSGVCYCDDQTLISPINTLTQTYGQKSTKIGRSWLKLLLFNEEAIVANGPSIRQN